MEVVYFAVMYIDKFIYKKNESYSQQWMWLKEQFQKEDVAWRVGREAGRKETGIKHMGKNQFSARFLLQTLAGVQENEKSS